MSSSSPSGHDDPHKGLSPASREFSATAVSVKPSDSADVICDDPIQMGVLVSDTPQEASGILPRKPTDPPSGGGQVMYAGAEA